MDAIIKKLRETDPADYNKVVEVGIEGLKEVLKSLPGIPTYGYEYKVTSTSGGYQYERLWAFTQRYALDIA